MPILLWPGRHSLGNVAPAWDVSIAVIKQWRGFDYSNASATGICSYSSSAIRSLSPLPSTRAWFEKRVSDLSFCYINKYNRMYVTYI